MTEKNKQTECVEEKNPPKSQDSLACERAAYDDAARHFGVDVMALRHYFPKGRP
jgi:hypothetical protein